MFRAVDVHALVHIPVCNLWLLKGVKPHVDHTNKRATAENYYDRCNLDLKGLAVGLTARASQAASIVLQPRHKHAPAPRRAPTRLCAPQQPLAPSTTTHWP
jgi:hypothetical protein